MSFQQALAALRSYWWIPVCTMLLGGAAAVAVSLYVMTPVYTSYTQLFVAGAPNKVDSEVLQNSQFSLQRVSSYTLLAASPEMARQLVESLRLHEDPGALVGRITATTPPNTAVINVTVTDSSARRAQQIAAGIDTLLPHLVDEVESAGTKNSPVTISVVTKPQRPATATSPNVTRNGTLGALAGLLVGLGLVVARNLLDGSIKTVDQVEALSDAPVVGLIPRSRVVAARKDTRRAGLRSWAEGYRQVATALQFIGAEDAPRLILVTSALPGEGRTTLTANLARVLGGAHGRVMVLEADFRNPAMGRYLGLPLAPGLADVLGGSETLDAVTRSDAETRFSVVVAGEPPFQPGELLGFEDLPDVLARARKDYDLVLVDAPALLPVADALALARMADGVLLCVGYGTTRPAQLKRATAELRRAGARTLGVVFNGVPSTVDLPLESVSGS